MERKSLGALLSERLDPDWRALRRIADRAREAPERDDGDRINPTLAWEATHPPPMVTPPL